MIKKTTVNFVYKMSLFEGDDINDVWVEPSLFEAHFQREFEAQELSRNSPSSQQRPPNTEIVEDFLLNPQLPTTPHSRPPHPPLGDNLPVNPVGQGPQIQPQNMQNRQRTPEAAPYRVTELDTHMHNLEVNGTQPLADCVSQNVYVAKSTIPGAGLGLFACVNILSGERFLLYLGERVPHSTIQQKYGRNVFATYVFAIKESNGMDIDASQPTLSNLARFANECRNGQACRSNAKFEQDQYQNIWLIATADIAKSQEILIDNYNEGDPSEEASGRRRSPQRPRHQSPGPPAQGGPVANRQAAPAPVSRSPQSPRRQSAGPPAQGGPVDNRQATPAPVSRSPIVNNRSDIHAPEQRSQSQQRQQRLKSGNPTKKQVEIYTKNRDFYFKVEGLKQACRLKFNKGLNEFNSANNLFMAAAVLYESKLPMSPTDIIRHLKEVTFRRSGSPVKSTQNLSLAKEVESIKDQGMPIIKKVPDGINQGKFQLDPDIKPVDINGIAPSLRNPTQPTVRGMNDNWEHNMINQRT